LLQFGYQKGRFTMLLNFVVLGALANLNGGGGLGNVYSRIANEGFGYSKYRVKASLKDLVSIGAVCKVGKSFSLTLLGANLVAADIAAANGEEVISKEYIGVAMPAYQKGL